MNYPVHLPLVPVVEKAFAFAKAAHESINQRRKYTNEPYILHPIEVSFTVCRHVPNDLGMICAALLHDVVEDTPVTIEEVLSNFGEDITTLVSELTDVSRPEDGNRAARKAIDLKHTAQASPRAKTIKLADLMSNTRSIAEHDQNFARVYLKEKMLLMEVLTEGNTVLYKEVMHILEDAKKKLGI